MGLLSVGTPLSWPDSLPYHNLIKQKGLRQFCTTWLRNRNRSNDPFLWGDEVEALIVTLRNGVQLSLRAHLILEQLADISGNIVHNTDTNVHANFLPEYGKHMIEATPGEPYGAFSADLQLVEKNMLLRRRMIETLLEEDERILTITAFPTLGVPHATHSLEGALHTQPEPDAPDGVTLSVYIPEDIISPHPRFATLSANIRLRRGKKVDIRVPLFQDENTATAISKYMMEHPAHSSVPKDINHVETIHMDAMVFGMGNCCLQVTFQATSLKQSRHLYDQLAIVAPIMLALTAATPFLRGRISDLDTRWTVISQACDDRTPEELGLVKNGAKNHTVLVPLFEGLVPFGAVHGRTPDVRCSSTPAITDFLDIDINTLTNDEPDLPYCKQSTSRVFKSRYDSISCFISQCPEFRHDYNDLPLEINLESYKMLRAAGVDELLARHVAHLFIRDPLVIFSDRLNLNDNEVMEMFENIQSSNWQSVRFKPPPLHTNIGWRVEFRTMEVQVTDFENAAFTVFIGLLNRALLYYQLNLYIPISKVDENMRRAHSNDASRVQKFFWRCDLSSNSDSSYKECSMRDILLGNGEQKGLLSIVRRYVRDTDVDVETSKQLELYFLLLEERAKGRLLTAAQWMRIYISRHPLYKKDSIISPELCRDLILTLDEISHGRIHAVDLLGDYVARVLQHVNQQPQSPYCLDFSDPLAVTTLYSSRLTDRVS